MAKKAEEFQPTKRQSEIIEGIKNNNEISEDKKLDMVCEYQEAATVVNKLNNNKKNVTKNEIETLLKYNKDNSFTSRAASLLLDDTQKKNLIANVVRIKDPELAHDVALDENIILGHNDAVTEIIGKNTDSAVDYAAEYYKQNGDREDLKWCFDLVVKNVKKDLTRKKPKDKSFEPLARFIYETQTLARYEGETELKPELYEPFIKGAFADRIFGTDEETNKIKDDKKKKDITDKKQKFVEKLKEAIVEEHKKATLAKLEAQEAAETKELESNTEFKKYIDNVVNTEFHAKHELDYKTAADFMNSLKKQHPKDFDAYLKKLRSSRTYKKAYEKYTKMFADERAKLRDNAIKMAKEELNKASQHEALNANNKNRVEEKPKEEEKAETL